MLTKGERDVLCLLVGHPLTDVSDLDLAELREIAVRAGVIVRLADALRARAEPREALPPRLAAAAAAACAASERVLEIVDRLGARCNALGLSHAFLHVVERYPDGGPITLLVAGPISPAIDREILAELPATAWPRGGFQRRLGGITSYATAYGIRLNIRHGRLGRFGEHARYARLLLQRALPSIAGTNICQTATREDYLLLLVIERAYARPALHLGDLASLIPLLRPAGTESFNWDYVFATALSIGILPSVSAYLHYVDSIHRHVFTQGLVPPDVLTRFRTLPAPRRRAAAPAGRFPPALDAAFARGYVRAVADTLESGRWYAALRLSLLPLVAALTGARGARETHRAGI